jgi:hypothetical protein
MVELTRLIGGLILALGAISGWMGATQTFCPEPALARHLRSRVVAIELAQSAAEVRQILGDPDGQVNRRVMRQQVALDWPFIASYWLAFSGLGLLLARRDRLGAKGLAWAVVAGATLVVACDIAENVGILRVLTTDPDRLTEELVATVRIPSLVKWGLLGVVEGISSLLFLGHRDPDEVVRPLSTIAGVALAGASALGLLGLVWNRSIEWSVFALATGFLAAAILFLVYPASFLRGL